MDNFNQIQTLWDTKWSVVSVHSEIWPLIVTFKMQFVALASTRMPDTATRATVAVAWLHCDFMMLHPHCLWPTVKINQNSFSSDNKVKYDICFLPLYPTPCTHTGCLLLHWAVGREEVTVRNTSMTATEATEKTRTKTFIPNLSDDERE